MRALPYTTSCHSFQLPLAVLTNLGWRWQPFIIFHDSLGLFGKSGDCSASSGVSGITWGQLELSRLPCLGGSLLGLECAGLRLGAQLGCLPEPLLGSPLSRLPAWPRPSQYGEHDSKRGCNQHLRAKAVGPASPYGDCFPGEAVCNTHARILNWEGWGVELPGSLSILAVLNMLWLSSLRQAVPCPSAQEAHRKHGLHWSWVILRRDTTAVRGWTYFHIDIYWVNLMLQPFPVQVDGLGVSLSMSVLWPQADTSPPVWHKIYMEKLYMIDWWTVCFFGTGWLMIKSVTFS